MESHAQPARMTAEAFWDQHAERPDRIDLREHPEWADGYPDMELVDGIVVEGEVTGFRHQTTVTGLQILLEPWLRARGGRSWASGGLRLGPADVRSPDLMAWWSGQRVTDDGMFTDIPNLCVEVISPRPRDVHRDRTDKMAAYAARGVPHYWLLEPTGRSFEAYNLRPPRARGGYTRVALAQGGLVQVPGFSGLTLDLDALWRYVEGE